MRLESEVHKAWQISVRNSRSMKLLNSMEKKMKTINTLPCDVTSFSKKWLKWKYFTTALRFKVVKLYTFYDLHVYFN